MTEIFSEVDKSRLYGLKDKLKVQLYKTLERVKNGMSGFVYEDQMIIAGGIFTSLFHIEIPKDHDIFILDATAEQKDHFERSLLKHGNTDYMKNKKVVGVHTNESTKEQWILTSHKTREELIAGFDLQHCAVSYSVAKDKLYISPAAYECMSKKILRPNYGKTYRDVAPWRVEKFKSRGFKDEIVRI